MVRFPFIGKYKFIIGLILMTSHNMASVAVRQCAEVTSEEAETVWLRYWQLETQLHWSFWLLPNLKENGERTLEKVESDYIDVNYTVIYGSKKCPKVPYNYFLNLQPDCPVYYVIENDPNRIPQNIMHVRCSCRRCRHDRSDEKGCTPVYTYTRVMRRMGDCSFAPVLEAVPVACSCSSKIRFVSVGNN